MQTAIKAAADFSSSDIKKLANETTRLEIAGVKLARNNQVSSVNSCVRGISINDEGAINAIVEKVKENLNNVSMNTSTNIPTASRSSKQPDDASFVNYNSRGAFIKSADWGFRRGYRGRRGDFRKPSEDKRRQCRACRSTDHFIRDCPTRFCQACGQRGHDQFNNGCQNFQPWLDDPQSSTTTKETVTLVV